MEVTSISLGQFHQEHKHQPGRLSQEDSEREDRQSRRASIHIVEPASKETSQEDERESL